MKTPFRVTQATLDVLEVLLTSTQQQPVHGYFVARFTSRPTGSVYPILDRLEAHGWLTSEPEDANPVRGRPPRRFYSLTSEVRQDVQRLLQERRPRLGGGA